MVTPLAPRGAGPVKESAAVQRDSMIDAAIILANLPITSP
jgi:hypothetical protein